MVESVLGTRYLLIQHGAEVTSNPNPDHTLIAKQMIAGDAKAAHVFVTTYYEWMHTIVKAKYPNLDAKDVVHDSLMLVIKKLKAQQIHDISKIRSFIRTTTINTAHHHHRLGKRFATDVDVAVVQAELNTAAEEMDWDRKLALTKKMIEQLPRTRDRAVLKAHYFDHLSKQQICDQMGFSSQLFDSIIHRAKKRLQGLVQKNRRMNAVKGSFTMAWLLLLWQGLQVMP